MQPSIETTPINSEQERGIIAAQLPVISSKIKANIEKVKEYYSVKLAAHQGLAEIFNPHIEGLLGLENTGAQKSLLVQVVPEHLVIDVNPNNSGDGIILNIRLDWQAIYSAFPAPGREGESWLRDVEDGVLVRTGSWYKESPDLPSSRSGYGIMCPGLAWSVPQLSIIHNFHDMIYPELVERLKNIK